MIRLGVSKISRKLVIGGIVAAAGSSVIAAAGHSFPAQDKRPVLTGQAAMADWQSDAPGVRRKITVSDLPKPFTNVTKGSGPRIIPWPEGQGPKALPGFRVDRFAVDLNAPRFVAVAPNGDVFVSESRSNRIVVLRDTKGEGKADVKEVFAENLSLPFSMAFYPLGPNPSWLYVADTDQIIRYPYQNGDLKARGAPEVVASGISGGGQLRGGGHWTRGLCFSRDGSKMYVSIGSATDAHLDPNVQEDDRALIREYNADGTGMRVYATGTRNPVTLAVNPRTGDLWSVVQERDFLGEQLPCDYVTRIRDGGFYGWPWYYNGPNEDPRHAGKHPELKDKVIVPDVLVAAHSATMGICFYTGRSFPREYQNDAFVANHGSSDRATRTGYKVLRIIQRNGVPTGEYEDFVTGFSAPGGEAYGRLVGLAVAKDGSLLVCDDGVGALWRVSYSGRTAQK